MWIVKAQTKLDFHVDLKLFEHSSHVTKIMQWEEYRKKILCLQK